MKNINKAVILAAGMGTRFLPITKSIPKEMLPLVDQPTIHYIVEEIVQSRINQILIVVSSYKDSIVDYFDSAYELEKRLTEVKKNKELQTVQKVVKMANIHYIRQKEPLGLGHALLMAEKFVGNEPFAALTGDDFIYTGSKKPAIAQCINLFKKTNSSIIGVQKINPKNISMHGIIDPKKINEKEQSILLKSIIEKPKPENAPSEYGVIGRYILEPKIFKYIKTTPKNEKNEIELTNALMKYCKHEKIYAKILQGQRFDIGSKLGWIEATIFVSLLNQKDRKEIKEILQKYLDKNV